MKKVNLRFAGFIPVLAIILILSSCVPQKRIKYLQNELEEDAQLLEFKPQTEKSYKVQPGDNLYIQVVSNDPETAQLFGNSNNRSNYLNSDVSVYLQSYTVDKNGEIDFLLVDKIYVEDLEVEEIRDKIQTIVNEYLVEATVFVKMINFNFTILGEVRHPGKFQVYQDQINIFQALGMAGDLTDFAERKKVKLMRQTEDGIDVYTIDLTRDDIIESEFYYIMPNDIIYVEPLKIKQFGFTSFPYSILFSTVSATLLILNYLK